MPRIVVFLAVLILTAMFAFADVDLSANGYNWIGYNNAKKTALIDLIYSRLNIENANVASGVSVLDSFYTQVEKRYTNDYQKKDAYLKEPCMNIMLSILKQSANR